MNPMPEALERNVRLYSLYRAATSVSPWLPVFYLYFLERVELGDAVLLASVYYFSVFLLEVPSGYYSDRFGRRPTLITASILTALCFAIFPFADNFTLLAVAQILLASGIALQSGSDSALLYDSMRALGREDDYAEYESIAQKWSMTALACSCLVGGLVGLIDLRLVYLVALVAAVAATVICLMFIEPPIESSTPVKGFIDQLGRTFSYFSHPLLAWILAFFVIGFSLEHVPFEFYQPYLKLLGEDSVTGWLAADSTPLVSGVVIGISMFGGAIGAALSQRLGDRTGLRALLLSSIAIQVLIIAGLSIVLHPIMLALVLFRNFAMSMARGPMLGAIAPKVQSAQRATFLSTMSLCGRATFSAALATLSTLVIGTEVLNWPALSQVLGTSALVGILALSGLYVWSGRIRGQFASPAKG